jgi:ribosome-associated protein
VIPVADGISIAEWEISESFVRASGPGGQNVNRVATAVELRFEAERSPHLPPQVKARLRTLAGRRWTRDGAVHIVCDRFRTQAMNRQEARRRLIELIAKAAEPPPPARIATKPTPGAERRRIEGKVRRARLKALRGPVGEE